MASTSTIIHSFLDSENAPDPVKLILEGLKQQSPTPSRPEASTGSDSTQAIDISQLEFLVNSFQQQSEISSMYGPQSNTVLWHAFFQMISRATFEDSVVLYV